MRRISPILLVTIWIASSAAFARDCGAVKYEIGDIRENSASRLVQNVSVASDVFNRADLLCLAKELQTRHAAGHDEVYISVFDNRDAATQRPAIPIEARPRDYEIYQHEHATYVFKKATGENYLQLEPDFWNEATHSKIQLDGNQRWDCALEIAQNRCLMIIGAHLQYPEMAWRHSEAGSALIDATVEKDGTVTASAAVGGQPVAQSFRDVALVDARSWRFERGASVMKLRITYLFQVAGAAENYPVEAVQYLLPDRVVITANFSR